MKAIIILNIKFQKIIQFQLNNSLLKKYLIFMILKKKHLLNFQKDFIILKKINHLIKFH